MYVCQQPATLRRIARQTKRERAVGYSFFIVFSVGVIFVGLPFDSSVYTYFEPLELLSNVPVLYNCERRNGKRSNVFVNRCVISESPVRAVEKDGENVKVKVKVEHNCEHCLFIVASATRSIIFVFSLRSNILD